MTSKHPTEVLCDDFRLRLEQELPRLHPNNHGRLCERVEGLIRAAYERGRLDGHEAEESTWKGRLRALVGENA